MKKEMMENLSNIRKFLHLAYYQEHATKEEVYNFLQELLKYVFNFHNLKLSYYEISLQFVSSKELDDAESKITRYVRHPNKFVVQLNSKHKSYKRKSNDDASSFFSFIYYTLHEFGHIIQNIQDVEFINANDEVLELLYNESFIIDQYLEQSKEKRLILKALTKHLDAQEFMSFVEQDANEKAYIYYASIIENLIGLEEDYEFAEFLCCIRNFLEQIKKDNYSLYKQQTKYNQEAITKLKESNFDNNLFISVSSMLKDN